MEYDLFLLLNSLVRTSYQASKIIDCVANYDHASHKGTETSDLKSHYFFTTSIINRIGCRQTELANWSRDFHVEKGISFISK